MFRVSVVNQFYTAEILKEYVIRGNTAILKCNIPSFVADYVTVEGWLLDETTEIGPTKDDYGNPAKILPSFLNFCFLYLFQV